MEMINVFNFRGLHAPLSAIGFFSNPWLLAAWVLTFGMQLCAVYLPFLQKALHTVALGWTDWGLIFAIALPVIILSETYKMLCRHRLSIVPVGQEGKDLGK